MTRSSLSKLLDLDPEVDRTYRRRLRKAEDIVQNLNFDEDEEDISVSGSEQSVTQGENLAHISGHKTKIMADQWRTMVEYARPTLGSIGSCIV